MALSGIFYGTSSNPRIKPQISWSATQSVAGNYSDVTAKLQYTRSNSGYTTGGTWKGTLTINGDTATKSLYMEITYGNTTTVITHTVRVYHNDNGKKTITISGTGGIVTPAEASLKTTDISAQVTLDTIPRASGISATDCNIGAVSSVVVAKKDVSFTHTVGYKFGSLSGYLSAAGEPVTTAEVFSATVVNFKVPVSFYTQIPGSPSGVCTLTCTTYQGKTKIGTSTAGFTVTAAKSLCAPEASLQVKDTNEVTVALTGDPQVLVMNASVASCTLTATAKNSATIAKMAIMGKQTTGKTELSPVRSGSILYSATDSRGYETAKTYIAQTVPYVIPTVNLSVKREGPTSDTAVLTITGQCYDGSFGLQENALSMQVFAAGELVTELTPQLQAGNRYQASVTLTGLSYQQSHRISVTAADLVTSLEKSVVLPAGVPVFDWGEADFRFHVPVHADGGLHLGGVSLLDLTYPVGSVYISFDDANPVDLFGGAWKRILGQDGGDVFLCSCKEGETPGTFGGTPNGLADQICVSPAGVGGIITDNATGSYKSRVLVTRSTDYCNTAAVGAQPLSRIGTGTHYLDKNLPPFVKVAMWRRVA